MHTQRRLYLIRLGLLVLLALATAAPAYAAPANDDFGSPVVISALPFSTNQTTGDATTAGDDPICSGQSATVWYAFTPTTGAVIAADTFGSDYDTTLSVYTGTRGALNQIVCNDDTDGTQSRVVFQATANTTYYFMVGSFSDTPGGNLALTVDTLDLPPPLALTVSVNRAASVSVRRGTIDVSGTVSCTRPAAVFISGELAQKAPRGMTIRGSFYADVYCDGQGTWSSRAYPYALNDLRFIAGQALAVVTASAYDSDWSTYRTASATQVVIAKGSR